MGFIQHNFTPHAYRTLHRNFPARYEGINSNFSYVNKSLMCCSNHNSELPIIKLTFDKNAFEALLDSGANLSLIQPQVIDIF